MVAIPKGDMDEYGALSVNRTRPITIFPCHYGIVMTSLTRSTQVRTWLRQKTPWFLWAWLSALAALALASLKKAGFDPPGWLWR